MVWMMHWMDGKAPTSEESEYWNQHDSRAAGVPNRRFFRRSELSWPAYRGWQGDSPAWHMGGGPNQIYNPYNNLWPNWSSTYSGTGLGRDPERHGDGANFLFVDGRVEFMHYSVSGNAFYDISQLVLAGDFTGEGTVDLADYTVWADSDGRQSATHLPADANFDGKVDLADYTVWADSYGQTLPLCDEQGYLKN